MRMRIAAALATSVLACNALFGDSAQCTVDADCTRYGTTYVCGAEGTCVTRSVGPGTSDGGAGDGASVPGELASITINPTSAMVAAGQTQLFLANGLDRSGKTISPAPAFTWTVSGGGTIDGNGLFRAGNMAGGPFTVTATSGTISATASALVTVTTIMVGETNILDVDDSGNADLLLAQEMTLAQTATLRSLSFYIATAAGNLRLGLYDATGPGGGPGAKRAETAAFAAAAGWTAVPVVTPVSLTAGNYWLAYVPDRNDLHFNRAGDGTGKIAYFAFPFGEMPATFSDAPTTIDDHWSFYATMTVP